MQILLIIKGRVLPQSHHALLKDAFNHHDALGIAKTLSYWINNLSFILYEGNLFSCFPMRQIKSANGKLAGFYLWDWR